jgi:acetyl esterase
MALEPQTAWVLEMVKLSGRPKITTLTEKEARALYRETAKALDVRPAPEQHKIEDRGIPGPKGEIPIRVYTPVDAGAEKLPVLVFYHGGGWVIGDLETHDGPCRVLARDARCIVVAIDYRMGPEHRFPAAVEDSFAALTWVAQNAASFGGDASRLAVCGDSAGGNISAVMAHLAKAAGKPKLCFQLLIYPATDARGGYFSLTENAVGYVLEKETMDWFYQRHFSEADKSDPRCSPLLNLDFTGLPPALVVTCGYDPLRDEGKAYADKLAAFGVPVTYRCFAGSIHGFFSQAGALSAAAQLHQECASALRRAFGGIGQQLHPDAAKIVETARARPAMNAGTVAQAREQYDTGTRVAAPKPQEVASVQDRAIPGPGGDLKVRIYRPVGAKPDEVLPALVYFHGGGWVLGHVDGHDTVTRHLANAAKAVVVSVDYRLAPEHKYPAAVDDAYAATCWVAANAKELKIDPTRIGVGGDSAGGTLAAVVCLIARERANPKLGFQMLIYPATDRRCGSASQHALGEGYSLTQAAMHWFYDLYAPDAPIEDWRVSPALAASFGNLPPAFVLTAGFDPLRDEGRAYADALQAAGVPVTYRCYDGQIHGFVRMGGVNAESASALNELGTAMRQVFFRP